MCVTYETSVQAKYDNTQAQFRRQPNSTACVVPYVWRGAFPGDNVCVTPGTMAATVIDNALAASRRDLP